MTENNEEKNLIKGYVMMLYFAGTMVMFDPSRECIYDFWTKGILKQLPVKSSNSDFIKAAGLLRDSADKTDGKYENMRNDYMHLFSGAGVEQPAAPPFASVYLDPEKLIAGQNTLDIRNIYKKYNWEPKAGKTIPDDHLGNEILFLTYLLELYIKNKDKELHAKLSSEIHEYIERHLLTWIPQWSNDVQKHATTLGYKGIAMLVLASLSDINNIVSKGTL